MVSQLVFIVSVFSCFLCDIFPSTPDFLSIMIFNGNYLDLDCRRAREPCSSVLVACQPLPSSWLSTSNFCDLTAWLASSDTRQIFRPCASVPPHFSTSNCSEIFVLRRPQFPRRINFARSISESLPRLIGAQNRPNLPESCSCRTHFSCSRSYCVPYPPHPHLHPLSDHQASL